MLWECCTQYASKFGKLSSGTGLEKVSFHFYVKENSNYSTIALISYSSKVMLKILQARLQEYVNCELPDVQAGFIKGRWTRDQVANIHWIMNKSNRVPEKHLLYWLCQSLWLCGSQQTLENSSRKFFKVRPPDLPPEKSVCRSRSNS